MGTLKEEFELLKIRINNGEGNKIIHVVDHEAERRRKTENPAKSTRVVVDCRTPELWTAFQLQKERFMQVAVDPGIAVELIVRALRTVSDGQLKSWLAEGKQDEAEAALSPPKAEIPEPDWLK